MHILCTNDPWHGSHKDSRPKFKPFLRPTIWPKIQQVDVRSPIFINEKNTADAEEDAAAGAESCEEDVAAVLLLVAHKNGVTGNFLLFSSSSLCFFPAMWVSTALTPMLETSIVFLQSWQLALWQHDGSEASHERNLSSADHLSEKTHFPIAAELLVG